MWFLFPRRAFLLGLWCHMAASVDAASSELVRRQRDGPLGLLNPEGI